MYSCTIVSVFKAMYTYGFWNISSVCKMQLYTMIIACKRYQLLCRKIWIWEALLAVSLLRLCVPSEDCSSCVDILGSFRFRRRMVLRRFSAKRCRFQHNEDSSQVKYRRRNWGTTVFKADACADGAKCYHYRRWTIRRRKRKLPIIVLRKTWNFAFNFLL